MLVGWLILNSNFNIFKNFFEVAGFGLQIAGFGLPLTLDLKLLTLNFNFLFPPSLYRTSAGSGGEYRSRTDDLLNANQVL